MGVEREEYTRFASLLGNGSQIWLELVVRTAMRCAPHARAKAVSGKKKASLRMLTNRT